MSIFYKLLSEFVTEWTSPPYLPPFPIYLKPSRIAFWTITYGGAGGGRKRGRNVEGQIAKCPFFRGDNLEEKSAFTERN